MKTQSTETPRRYFVVDMFADRSVIVAWFGSWTAAQRWLLNRPSQSGIPTIIDRVTHKHVRH